MDVLARACGFYQSLFRNSHPEEGRLVELHQSGQIAQFLNEYFQHEYRKGLDMLGRFERWSENWGDMKALDFGCGGGGLTYRIAARFREAWGIDLDAQKLSYAEKQAEPLGVRNVRFVCYEGERLPFAQGSFDCVFCIDVIEHLPNPARFVREFFRILRPGGLLFISFGPPWRHAHGKHMWAKLPGWWTHLLFPRAVVMEISGFPAHATWEDLGMHRLTVGKFEQAMKPDLFRKLRVQYHINKVVYPLKWVPVVREFFIAEVVGAYRKPDDAASAPARSASHLNASTSHASAASRKLS